MSVPSARPVHRPRRLVGPAVASAVVLAAGAGVPVARPAPADAAAALAPGCRAPTPRATEAGPAKAAVRRLVRRAGRDLAKAPVVRSPTGRRPTRLVTEDVVRCSGPRARTGDDVQLRYTLVAWGGRDRVIDSTWRRGTAPLAVPLDDDVLIDGLVRGVRGMAPGGRRLVVVPPRLGYGDTPPAGVRRGSTLIVVVDLVAIG